MDRSTFVAITEDLSTTRHFLTIRKAADYADEDVLANFKRISKLAELLRIDPGKSPADYARFMILMKLDRWCNLCLKETSPKNESTKDTVIDLLNYTDLAYACEVSGEV